VGQRRSLSPRQGAAMSILTTIAILFIGMLFGFFFGLFCREMS
jgi:hypothetical protein